LFEIFCACLPVGTLTLTLITLLNPQPCCQSTLYVYVCHAGPALPITDRSSYPGARVPRVRRGSRAMHGPCGVSGVVISRRPRVNRERHKKQNVRCVALDYKERVLVMCSSRTHTERHVSQSPSHWTHGCFRSGGPCTSILLHIGLMDSHPPHRPLKYQNCTYV